MNQRQAMVVRQIFCSTALAAAVTIISFGAVSLQLILLVNILAIIVVSVFTVRSFLRERPLSVCAHYQITFLCIIPFFTVYFPALSVCLYRRMAEHVTSIQDNAPGTSLVRLVTFILREDHAISFNGAGLPDAWTLYQLLRTLLLMGDVSVVAMLITCYWICKRNAIPLFQIENSYDQQVLRAALRPAALICTLLAMVSIASFIWLIRDGDPQAVHRFRFSSRWKYIMFGKPFAHVALYVVLYMCALQVIALLHAHRTNKGKS